MGWIAPKLILRSRCFGNPASEMTHPAAQTLMIMIAFRKTGRRARSDSRERRQGQLSE